MLCVDCKELAILSLFVFDVDGEVGEDKEEDDDEEEDLGGFGAVAVDEDDDDDDDDGGKGSIRATFSGALLSLDVGDVDFAKSGPVAR